MQKEKNHRLEIDSAKWKTLVPSSRGPQGFGSLHLKVALPKTAEGYTLKTDNCAPKSMAERDRFGAMDARFGGKLS